LGAFGEKLRKHREQRGLALDAISNITKISPRMLRALEEEHFDQLPGGVFNKGFVRAYARMVGLNEEETLTEYLGALRESQIQQQTILPDFRTSAAKPSPVAAPDAHQQARHPDVAGEALGGSVVRTNVAPKDDSGATISVNDSAPTSKPAGGNGQDGNDRDAHAESAVGIETGNRHSAAPDTSHSDFAREDFPKRDFRKGDRRKHDRRQNQNTQNQNIPGADDSEIHARGMLGPYLQNEAVGNDARNNSSDAGNAFGGGIPWRKLAAALLVVFVLLAIWNLRRDRDGANAAHSEPAPSLSLATPASTPAAQPPSVSSLTAKQPSSGNLSSGNSSSGTLSLGNTAAKSTTGGAISLPATSATTAKSADPVPPKRAASLPDASSKPAPRPFGTHAAAGKVPASFRLVIRAQENSWISIMADGKPVAQETLIAPANTSVRASREIVVRTGNAAGISFMLNGKEISARGSEGQAKTFTFDAEGLRATPLP